MLGENLVSVLPTPRNERNLTCWAIMAFCKCFPISPEPAERFLGDAPEGEQPLLLDEAALGEQARHCALYPVLRRRHCCLQTLLGAEYILESRDPFYHISVINSRAYEKLLWC